MAGSLEMKGRIMKTPLVGLLLLLLFRIACVSDQRAVQPSTTPSAIIRAALCDIDSQDYSAAKKTLESLPDSAKNLAVRKLLVAVQVRMIKQNDKTPENLTLIRKAIEDYKRLQNDLQLNPEQKQQIDACLLNLYGQLGEEELKNE